MDRRYKLRQDDKPATLATLGGGDTAELFPPAWEPIAGEYPGGA